MAPKSQMKKYWCGICEKLNCSSVFSWIFSNNDEDENADNSRETPRKNPSSCANNDGSNKHKMSPNRTIDIPVTVTRIQALHVICCSDMDDVREVKRKHRLLARKCHPDKWRVVCEFDR